jgi:hypothetical protein
MRRLPLGHGTGVARMVVAGPGGMGLMRSHAASGAVEGVVMVIVIMSAMHGVPQ